MGLGDHPPESVLHLRVRGVRPSAVGALHDEDVGAFLHRFRVADDGDAGAPDVAAVEEPDIPPRVFILDLEEDVGTPEEVTGVDEGQVDPRHDLPSPVVADADEVLHRPRRVILRVERLEGRLPLLLPLPVYELYIPLMDVTAVEEHDGAEVPGGGGAVDVPREAALHQAGDAAGVIDVGVGEDEDVDVGVLAGASPAVDLEGLLAAALEKTAVEEDAVAVHFDEVPGAGDGAGRSGKGDLHFAASFRGS